MTDFVITNLTRDDNIFDDDVKIEPNKIHIRIQQRNGKKSITTVQGLPLDLDFKKLTRTWKKSMKCNGTVLEDETLGKIVQLQGDQRLNVKNFLLTNEICNENALVVHGF